MPKLLLTLAGLWVGCTIVLFVLLGIILTVFHSLYGGNRALADALFLSGPVLLLVPVIGTVLLGGRFARHWTPEAPLAVVLVVFAASLVPSYLLALLTGLLGGNR